MGKIWVEVCLISARGLRRSSSLWKLQWFAVGWIEPSNKYCTKIDASGNANPTWKTKFAALIDADNSNFQDAALHVKVYSREPVFLRERLQGTATVVLKEFLHAHHNKSSAQASSRPAGTGTGTGTGEVVASYQLRKGNSSKPQGFVDISIRISEEKEEFLSAYPTGTDGGQVLLEDHRDRITLSTDYGPEPVYPAKLPLSSLPREPNNQFTNSVYMHPAVPPYQAGTSASSGGEPSHASAVGLGPSYRPPQAPPPPPPPSNIGYIPTFIPTTDYINMPASVAEPQTGRGPRRGLALGVGAGALAAGAVIFGEDFMSGFDIPTGLQDPPTITISTDPPF